MTGKTPLELNEQTESGAAPGAAAETGSQETAGAVAEGSASPPPETPGAQVVSADGSEGGPGEHDAGKIADLGQIWQMVRQLAEHTTGDVLPALDRLDMKAKTLAGSIEENGTALRKYIEERSESGAHEGSAVEAAKQLGDRIKVHMDDFQRWHGVEKQLRRRWLSIALAVTVPVFLLLGVLVEQQFQIIPIHDPNGEWPGYMWENYGTEITDCATEATRIGSEVECSFKVRKL